MATTTSATNNTGSTLPAELLQGSSAKSTNSTEASDRFLKLLVTQMQNQDPLNPMDNAEVTSQLAQINTVTGIDKLNTTMTGFNTSLSQMQLMQGISMVGRQIVTEGADLNLLDGKRVGGFELNAAATNVSVDVKNASGNVIDTIDLGTAAQGQHGFEWTPPAGSETQKFTFAVTATSGNAKLTPTHLSTDYVDAIKTKDGALNLQLRNGSEVAYNKVKALS